MKATNGYKCYNMGKAIAAANSKTNISIQVGGLVAGAAQIQLNTTTVGNISSAIDDWLEET